ncbi:MAG TPA: GAF domain-containing protein [Hyphomicrobiaceae bacterium]|nr:GAF domain-containing protein [Hyphomicrobiaceae bacterium]
MISTIHQDREYFVGQSGKFPKTDDAGTLRRWTANMRSGTTFVGDDKSLVPDIQRDPGFADNETIKRWGVRFYADAPLRVADGLAIGALCTLGPEPRTL